MKAIELISDGQARDECFTGDRVASRSVPTMVPEPPALRGSASEPARRTFMGTPLACGLPGGA